MHRLIAIIDGRIFEKASIIRVISEIKVIFDLQFPKISENPSIVAVIVNYSSVNYSKQAVYNR